MTTTIEISRDDGWNVPNARARCLDCDWTSGWWPTTIDYGRYAQAEADAHHDQHHRRDKTQEGQNEPRTPFWEPQGCYPLQTPSSPKKTPQAGVQRVTVRHSHDGGWNGTCPRCGWYAFHPQWQPVQNAADHHARYGIDPPRTSHA